MKLTAIKKIKYILYLFSSLVLVLSILIVSTGFFNYETLKSTYNQRIDQNRLENLTIVDCNNVKLYEQGNFNANKQLREATFHIVGDKNCSIPTSVISQYLSSDKKVNIFNGYQPEKKFIKLTIDSKLCKRAYAYLSKYNGTILVANYKTGEIACMTSTPSIDCKDTVTNPKEGSYLNKSITQFTPGSVFKSLSVAALIENSPELVDEYTFECSGKFKHVTCSQAHGKVTLQEALYKSCNCGISNALTNNLSFSDYEDFFEKNEILSDETIKRFNLKKYVINSSDDIDYAWFVNGQSVNMIDPLTVASFYAVIANDGVVKDLNLEKDERKEHRIISSSTAAFLKDTLTKGMIEQYHSSIHTDSFGKTGTAQTSTKANSWFVACLTDSDKPYVIVTMLEKAGSSAIAKSLTSQFVNECILNE